MTRDTLYDVESYPNFFCVVARHVDLDHAGVFEVSERRNDAEALAAFVLSLERMVGFNNVGYDYLMVHYLVWGVRSGEFAGWTGLQIAVRMRELNDHIIQSPRNERLVIWERDYLVPQLDLMRVHHLDNKARGTSLKGLQFVMRSPSIEESPVPFDTWLTPEQMTATVDYCAHDVGETGRLLARSARQVQFRDELDARNTGGGSWANLSDTSIGKRFFREKLEERRPGCTKDRTIRGDILLGDVILPWIQFRHEPFERKKRMLQDTSVHASNIRVGESTVHSEAGGFGPVVHGGFRFILGAGGLHGSVKKRRVEATASRAIVDVDVTSFYPKLAIVNRFFPLHLGEQFCDVYAELFEERAKWAKKTAENEMLKLALNGVYGDSNNPFGPFYDPAYTLSITINGQLLLCLLAEAVMDIPGVEVIQANTDGLTITIDRERDAQFRDVCAWWEWGTGMTLERTDYRRMFVRDVNNYTAVPVDQAKPVKRIGAYEYELELWQNHSSLCVPRAAEAYLVGGEPPADYLARRLVTDPWDFMLRTKVDRNSRLYWGDASLANGHNELLEAPPGARSPCGRLAEVQRVTRYYVSTAGAPLTKVMRELRPGTGERRFDVQKNRTVQIANRYDGAPLTDVALDWYVAEAQKLIIR